MSGKYPYLTRNVRPSQPTFVSGIGLEMRDRLGRVLLDVGSQTSNLSLGQCHPSVTRAAASQVQQLLYASSAFSSQPFLDLSARLVELAPEGLTAANLMMCNGSDAVETACKIARLYKWTSKVLALRGGWHGETGGTLAFSPGHKDSLLSTDRSIVLSPEPTLASLAELIELTSDAAGVVIDPVGVSIGLFTRPDVETYLPRIRQLCTERDIVLIFDEVQTFGGFMGRTLFASQEFGVTPDVVCIAKAVGGGLPLAGVLCREELAELLSHNEAEFTNGANPVSCAAALAFLDVYSKDHEQFARNAEAYQAAVQSIAASCPDLDVRNHGFIATFQKREDRFRELWAAKAVSLALDEGIILRLTNLGQSVLVKPAIVIDPETAETVATRLASVFMRAAEETARPGVSLAKLRTDLNASRQGRSTPSSEYFRDLLATVDSTYEVRSRSSAEIEELTRQLPQVGVRVSRGFASNSRDLEYEPLTGTTLSDYLTADATLPESIINGLLVQHQRSLESAHANGIIIGGRWSENAVVGSSMSLKLIDFELAYSGSFPMLAAFEELYGLFDFAAHVVDPTIRARIVERMAPALFGRWRESAVQAWEGIRSFHAFQDTRMEGLPASSSAYDDVVDIIDRVAFAHAPAQKVAR
jgi:4-aminobutyrate aminotransferase-like enzyme